MRPLSGPQVKKLMETIIGEFKLAELDELIEAYGQNRERMGLGENYDTIVFNIILHLESRLETGNFLAFLHEQNPENNNLASVITELGFDNE